MTVLFGWLQRLICGRRDHERDTTTELIDEAERTRRELLRITDRLAGHVAQLKAFTRAYTRDSEGIDHG
jgi:N6-adenosine-specific RNA methylase IME4